MALVCANCRVAANASIDLVAHQIRGHLKTQRWFHKVYPGQRRQLHMVLQDPLFHQRIWKSSHSAQICRTGGAAQDAAQVMPHPPRQ